VLRAVRSVADTGGAVLVSLLQPSMEVFRLFDRVLIMTKGEIAYQGLRTEALHYFEGLGYTCPPTLNHAEFLRTLVTTSCSSSCVRPGRC
jgi:ABC-type multidrug transport system ATPase subunit